MSTRCLVAALLLAFPAWQRDAAAQAVHADSVGGVSLVVMSRDAGLPIAYARVDIPALGMERFTTRQGTFDVHGVPPGTYTVRTRFVGYRPAEARVTVRPGTTSPVTIGMSRLPVRLSEVHVEALRRCRTPGEPRAEDNPQLVMVLELLKENARRYRLLVEQYPFNYVVEREFMSLTRSGRTSTTLPELVRFQSDAGWRYRPGTLIIDRNDYLRLPTLAHLADSAFLATHCFAYGGLDTLAGEPVARIDFLPADNLRTPDVGGWIALDPDTYQIRGTVLTLSRARQVDRRLRSVEVTTEFVEISPHMPVFARVRGVRRYQAGRAGSIAEVVEHQQLREVQFLRDIPGGVATRPPARPDSAGIR